MFNVLELRFFLEGLMRVSKELKRKKRGGAKSFAFRPPPFFSFLILSKNLFP